MQARLLIFGLLTIVERCHGHYNFASLIVNGSVTPAWKYVRDVATMPGYESTASGIGKWYPVMDVTSKDIACNRDAGAASKTLTAIVLAGSVVGFQVPSFMGAPGYIVHEGPVMVYLAKSPDDELEHFDATTANWFKIYYGGPASENKWTDFEKQNVTFNIPKTTPPGKYLLRIEQIYPWPKAGSAQLYISCAHINIIGPGGGNPTELVKFPGAYKATDPGIMVPEEQYHERGLLKYKQPGPAVWEG